MAVTEFGKVLLSDDDGASWRRAGIPTTERQPPIWELPVFFADDGTVTILLPRGEVLRSKDRGDTWSVTETELRLLPAAPCADGRGLIVAVSADGEVHRSVDGGATWQRGRLMH